MKKTNRICFANRNQMTLYECELKGQISDGLWENSSPLNHWKCMCDAVASWSSDPSMHKINFMPKRRYNFAARQLLGEAGQRMINLVKFYSVYPAQTYYGSETVEQLFDNDGPSLIELSKSNNLSHYQEQELRKAMAMWGLDTVEELEAKMLPVYAYEYTMNELKKDLTEMSEIVNNNIVIDNCDVENYRNELSLAEIAAEI